MKNALWKSVVLALTGIVLSLSVMLFPKEAFQASLTGLKLWWEVVFPSLLPFFILSEVLIGFGVVHFLGVLLEPLMRPLFKVPGSGGFVWAMGLSSGFPAGAKLTARLWQENEISSVEGARLVSFTNCSNPLFIMGAVCIGFFQNAALGPLLAISHYAGNLLVGITMRFYTGDQAKENRFKEEKIKQVPFSFKNALLKMHQARLKDQRTIGKLLGDSVQSSIQTLLMIGGFIILFSVVSKMLELLFVTKGLSYMISYGMKLLSMPPQLSLPIMTGLFEITLGSKLSSMAPAHLLYQCMAVSFILAFQGFSVHAQVASILAATEIKFRPFLIARLLQGIFSTFLCFFLYPYFFSNRPSQAQAAMIQHEHMLSFDFHLWNKFLQISPMITLSALIISIGIWHRRSLRN